MSDLPESNGKPSATGPDVCTGIVGARTCCDVMKLQLRVGERGIVEEVQFRAFGCGTARAIASYVAGYMRGKTIDEAGTLTRSRLVQAMSLPPHEHHCAALAEEAIRAVVDDHRRKSA
ncbi:MAG: iron-sulfur cluster assembly scaffold protein [Planctomycetes bacterium]|nr:iron-sulfur cluster assembly scaffold protein [Planctomycetota bacterium]